MFHWFSHSDDAPYVEHGEEYITKVIKHQSRAVNDLNLKRWDVSVRAWRSRIIAIISNTQDDKLPCLNAATGISPLGSNRVTSQHINKHNSLHLQAQLAVHQYMVAGGGRGRGWFASVQPSKERQTEH